MDQLMTLFLVQLTHTVTLILIMLFPKEKWIDRLYIYIYIYTHFKTLSGKMGKKKS